MSLVRVSYIRVVYVQVARWMCCHTHVCRYTPQALLYQGQRTWGGRGARGPTLGEISYALGEITEIKI